MRYTTAPIHGLMFPLTNLFPPSRLSLRVSPGSRPGRQGFPRLRLLTGLMLMLAVSLGAATEGLAQSSSPQVKTEKEGGSHLSFPSQGFPPPLPISHFNQRFPVMSLAEELAQEMERLPPERRNAYFFTLPAGLRMFVMLKSSLETKNIIQDEAYAEFARRFPEKKAVLFSLHEKCKLFAPLLHESAAGGYLVFEPGFSFLQSLSREEIKLMGEIDGYLLGPTIYLQHHETAGVTPTGIDFLKSRAASSQSARRFLEILEKEAGQQFRPGKDWDDGFFFLPKKD